MWTPMRPTRKELEEETERLIESLDRIVYMPLFWPWRRPKPRKRREAPAGKL